MRVSLKRLRAMLRLMKDTPQTRKLALALRALSRASGARRNFDVSSVLLKRMGARPIKTVPVFQARALPAGLIEFDPVPLLKPARRALHKAARAERRVKRRCRRAEAMGDPTVFHAWRIRLKRLQYMREALGMRVPQSFIRTAARLGQIQDWAVLVGSRNGFLLSFWTARSYQ